MWCLNLLTPLSRKCDDGTARSLYSLRSGWWHLPGCSCTSICGLERVMGVGQVHITRLQVSGPRLQPMGPTETPSGRCGDADLCTLLDRRTAVELGPILAARMKEVKSCCENSKALPASWPRCWLSLLKVALCTACGSVRRQLEQQRSPLMGVN